MTVTLKIDFLDVYLPFLVVDSPQMSTFVAQFIASALRTEHRNAIVEWLPPADRIKEVKGKRGWEKPNLLKTDSPSRQGGWVVRNLVTLIESNDKKVISSVSDIRIWLQYNFQLQEAALFALATLANDNAPVASALGKASPTRESA